MGGRGCELGVALRGSGGGEVPCAASVWGVDDVENEEPLVVLPFALDAHGYASVAGAGVVVVVPDAQHGGSRRCEGEVQGIGGFAIGVEGEANVRVVLVEVVELVEEVGAVVRVHELVFERGVVGVSSVLPEENTKSIFRPRVKGLSKEPCVWSMRREITDF